MQVRKDGKEEFYIVSKKYINIKGFMDSSKEEWLLVSKKEFSLDYFILSTISVEKVIWILLSQVWWLAW